MEQWGGASCSFNNQTCFLQQKHKFNLHSITKAICFDSSSLTLFDWFLENYFYKTRDIWIERQKKNFLFLSLKKKKKKKNQTSYPCFTKIPWHQRWRHQGHSSCTIAHSRVAIKSEKKTEEDRTMKTTCRLKQNAKLKLKLKVYYTKWSTMGGSHETKS